MEKLFVHCKSSEIDSLIKKQFAEDKLKYGVSDDALMAYQSKYGYATYCILKNAEHAYIPEMVDIRDGKGILLRRIFVTDECTFKQKFIYSTLRNNAYSDITGEPVYDECGNILTDKGGWNVFYRVYSHVWIDKTDTDMSDVDFLGNYLFNQGDKMVDIIVVQH